LGSDASGEGEGGGEEGRERVAATHPDTRVTQAAAKLGPTWVRCTCGKKKELRSDDLAGLPPVDWDGSPHSHSRNRVANLRLLQSC
jgi:hypothetical protein